MILVFNDLSEMGIQSAAIENGYLQIKTVAATSAELRAKFSDQMATKKMTVKERGQTIAVYEGYTTLYRMEEYTGAILGVAMYKPAETPEATAELQAAAVEVSRIQAQNFTDEQALTVKAIYPAWEDVIGQTVKPGFKFVYGALYKVITSEDLLVQEQYVPGQGTESLYAVIDETHAGTLEDPIPYNGNMELEEGRYYIQDDVIYRCIRDTEVPVYHALKDLVGLYVEVV